MATGLKTAVQFRRRARVRAVLIVMVSLLAAAALGWLAGILGAGRVPAAVAIFPLLLVPLAMWRWPRATMIGLLFAALTIEQNVYTVGTHPGTFTDRLPFFRSLTKGTFFTPLELLLVAILVIWVMQGAVTRTWHVPRSPLAKAIFGMFAVAVILGVGLGEVHHGSLRYAFWELRPWYYLVAVYVLVSSFFANRDVIRPVLWTIVVGSGFKSLQGVYIYFAIARRMTPRPEAILSHEESFFFAVFLLATMALWLFQVRGPLRVAATALAPLVALADIGNARRTAFLLLYAGMAVLLVLAHAAMPDRRRALRAVGAVGAVLSLVYIGAFWNDGGSLGQPARAIRAEISPSARDLSSDQYRVIENEDLKLDIHSTRSIGEGFGVPIDYVIPTADITNLDPMIAYITHDSILYVWYRLGIVGEVAVWLIVGFAILAAGKILVEGNREQAAFGAIAICAVVGWVLLAYNDGGFTWFRIAVFMGFVFGALEVIGSSITPPPEPALERVPLSASAQR